jgi:hypothetical protein
MVKRALLSGWSGGRKTTSWLKLWRSTRRRGLFCTRAAKAGRWPVRHGLEHFQKNCSPAVGENERAVFWSFGFVSAQLSLFAKGMADELRLSRQAERTVDPSPCPSPRWAGRGGICAASGAVSAPSPKADDRHHSPKVEAGPVIKNPRSAWLQFFFERTNQN